MGFIIPSNNKFYKIIFKIFNKIMIKDFWNIFIKKKEYEVPIPSKKY